MAESEDIAFQDFFDEETLELLGTQSDYAQEQELSIMPTTDNLVCSNPTGKPKCAEGGPSSECLDDEELQVFVEQQKNRNTKKKTVSDLRKWYSWCESVSEYRKIDQIPPTELDRLLGHFFCKVRKTDNSLYEPDTLTCFQRSLDRHLTQELRKPYSILRDTRFASSREKLKAARKMLKKEGKGNKSNAAEPLETGDIDSMWASGALRDSSAEVLQNTVWFLLTLHLGLRGRDEHYKLMYGDFSIHSTSDGFKYVEFNERDTKTRSGESNSCRQFKPKMWSTPNNPSQCPVRIFETFLLKRPTEMCKSQSPFYLAINYNHSNDDIWYKKQRMGKDRINTIMRRMAETAGLSGKKTNHSARKSLVTCLTKNNIPETQIIQLTGHKNLQSLNSYKKATLQQQRDMSHVLSSYKTPETNSSSTPSKVSSGTMNQDLRAQSFFAGASLTGCTINIGFPTAKQTQSFTSINASKDTQ